MKLLLISLIFYLIAPFSSAYSEGIIANSSVSESTLTPSALKYIFLGTTTHWPDGQPITLCIDESDEDLKKQFYKKILAKNQRSYQRHWTKRLFSGDAASIPRRFGKSRKALEFVADKEGAVCFVAQLPAELPSTVKLISVKTR